jgi:hypothetical protein
VTFALPRELRAEMKVEREKEGSHR